MRLPALVEVVPSQHGLSDQMEEAAKEWFSVDPQDKVNYDVNIMTAQGPLGMFCWLAKGFSVYSAELQQQIEVVLSSAVIGCAAYKTCTLCANLA